MVLGLLLLLFGVFSFVAKGFHNEFASHRTRRFLPQEGCDTKRPTQQVEEEESGILLNITNFDYKMKLLKQLENKDISTAQKLLLLKEYDWIFDPPMTVLSW